jgi:hypothetical protein
MKQQEFLFAGTSGNAVSASLVYPHIAPLLNGLQSFIDLGGGMGAWSAMFEETGRLDFWLVDHPAIPVNELLIKRRENFVGLDLEKNLPPNHTFDFGICIEVLEHFSEKRALKILDYLCENCDLVLFSAAVPRQGGVGHINLQRHSYWHHHFSKRDFNWYDGFKHALLPDKDIKYWIRQNLFIYYRPIHASRFAGLSNYTHPDFELVHTSILNKPIGKKEWFHLFREIFFKRS